jgi:nitroreductase
MADETYPNEAIANIFNRRSIRGYTNKSVSKEIIQQIVDAGCMAPSLLNSQPWLFTVYQGERRELIYKHMRRTLRYLEDMMLVLEPDQREAFANSPEAQVEKELVIKFFDTLGGAPAIIVVTMKQIRNDINRRMALIACGGAIQNMELAATSLGLATCCVGSALWIEEEIMEEMGNGHKELVTILTLGYPDYEAPMTKRRKAAIDWVGP